MVAAKVAGNASRCARTWRIWRCASHSRVTLAAASVTRLWLAQRQMRHVRAHREALPATFAATIPLASPQKAAAYTVAKSRLGTVAVVLGAGVRLPLSPG